MLSGTSYKAILYVKTSKLEGELGAARATILEKVQDRAAVHSGIVRGMPYSTRTRTDCSVRLRWWEQTMLAGGRVVLIKDFMREVFDNIRSRRVNTAAIPEEYPLAAIRSPILADSRFR